MKKGMKRFKNRRTTSTAAILCMAALLFAVLLAGCSVQKETEASGDQQQETWSEEMKNSTALSEEPDDTDAIGNADNPEDTGDTGNPENPEDTSVALTLPILDEINSKGSDWDIGFVSDSGAGSSKAVGLGRTYRSGSGRNPGGGFCMAFGANGQ